MDELPDAINPDKQKLSVSSIKAELLKNLIPINDKTVPPGKEGSEKKLKVYTEFNSFLQKRVDAFVEIISLLEVLQEVNPNKIPWYYEIFKEGLEMFNDKAGKYAMDLDFQEMWTMVDDLSKMSTEEMCALGQNCLTDIFAQISAWYRDTLLRYRKEKVYNSKSPLEWFKAAEENDEVLMKTITGNLEGLNIHPDVTKVLDMIQLLRSRKL